MKDIIDACVELVTVNGRPFSMLNDLGLRKILDPVLNGVKNSVVINSESIRKYLHEECDQIKKTIMKDIHFKLISLKLDAVTRLNRAFLGINIQYIVDDSIILKTIGLIELTESHTAFFLLGIYLKDTILNILKKFKIDINQVYTITSDNGANMLKAIDLFNDLELEVDEPVYELINDDSDTSSTSDDNNDNNSDLENVSTLNPGLDDGEISDLLNENFDDVDEQYEKTEIIVTDIVAQNIGGEIFTGIRCVAHTLQLAVIDSLKGSTVEKLLNKVRILVKKLRNQTYLYLIKKEKLKSP
ncbi:uncharacterized protein LOC111033930, partial [Myzus persicae]|uniref:uncharacterized protein LOC111033930 n=1 Tax=Myzus persicae TaxID=13164 RepID=UPI000B93354D